VGELPGAIPSWLTDIGVVTMVIIFGVGLARNWIYTAGQVDKMAEQYEKVNKIWEQVATERQQTITMLSDSIGPVLQGNEAILRAVENLQRDQEIARRTDRGRYP
jgi:hypothetical protein